jgi:hypothetical protein
MNINRYDFEESTHYEIEAYNGEEVAKMGDLANIHKNIFYDEPPSLYQIGQACKKKGLDTFELRKITEATTRYCIDDGIMVVKI